jgi:hypothetical protein
MTEPVTTASTASTFADIGTGLAGVSSLGSLFSGNDANSTAMDMQRWDMAFQKDMRAWQYNFMRGERKAANRFSKMMSDTAVQRRMRDMKRAGINPILAAKYDASTPSGVFAGAPGGSSAGGHGPMANKDLQRSQALAASASAMKGMAELRNIHAQTKNINADTRKKDKEAKFKHTHEKTISLIATIMDAIAKVFDKDREKGSSGKANQQNMFMRWASDEMRAIRSGLEELKELSKDAYDALIEDVERRKGIKLDDIKVK